MLSTNSSSSSSSKKSKEEKIDEIVAETGLSEFSLHVDQCMKNSKGMKINNMFRIVCPNKKIRCLSKEVVRREAASAALALTGKQVKGEAGEQKKTTTTKKSDDELRKTIVRAREKQLHDTTMQVCGSTNVKKLVPVDQKDYRLMFEFLGWGQVESEFYVFLYYVGPENKGPNEVELTRHVNWHIVPESHLGLFHKRIGNDYARFLRQVPFDVKAISSTSKHIQYDVRYILSKWRGCTKDVIKTHIALVEANKALFGFKESLSTKHHKKRTKDEMDATNALALTADGEHTSPSKKKSSSSSSKKSKLSHPTEPVATVPVQQPKRDYRIPLATCRQVLIAEHTSLCKFPLGENKKVCGGFKLDHMIGLFNNNLVREERPPTSYAWEPIQFVKAWFLVSDQARLRKQIVQSLIKKFSLQFEFTQYESFQAIINDNVGACDFIKEAHDGFIWACMLFHLFTMKGMIPDHIEQRLNTV